MFPLLNNLIILGLSILLYWDYQLTLSQTNPYFFICLQYMSIDNTVGKVEIARNEQFLLFPHCFLPFLENFLSFSSNLKLSSANSFCLGE